MKPTPGTLIAGTMRPEDLFPAFLAVARQHNPAIIMEDETVLYAYARAKKGQWDHEAIQYGLERLFDILDNLSPPGHYFGASDGDGSDYGWWQEDEL